MPYKCVHCSQAYPDGAQEVLEGCGICKSKFFFYMREEKLRELEAEQSMDIELTPLEKKQMEKDVRELAGIADEEKPVFLDFESVRVIKPGKYLLDLAKLFDTTKPRVYQLEEGKYIIDVVDFSTKMK